MSDYFSLDCPEDIHYLYYYYRNDSTISLLTDWITFPLITMRPPNPGTSAQDEMKDAILQMLFFINFGDRAEEAAKIAEDRCSGFLTIGGKTIAQIMFAQSFTA